MVEKCERDEQVLPFDLATECQLALVKKVLAIYEPRFIFTAASLRVDGLPTQVTTELPGNESTMGSEALDHR